MPTHRATFLRRVAVLAGVVALSATTVVTVSAANPAALKPRDAGDAWDKGPAPAADGVIVTFKPGTSASAKARVAERAGLTKVRNLHGVRDAGVYRSSASAAAIRRTTASLDDVVSVTPDLKLQRYDDPSGEQYWNLLWGMHNTGQTILGRTGSPNVDIDGLQAEGVTGGDPAVTVAVIDDGVDFSHPDLADRAWTNPGESGSGKETNGIDDDGNGYIDDVNGWDFCNNDNTVHDFDQDFHGTHVSGTIAASLNGVGVVGVAPNVKIMALKFLDDGPACGDTSMALEAIAYAKSFGVVISNNSWGGRGPLADFQPLYDAIRDSGMLFIISAGNNGIDNDTDPSPAYPATFDLPNIVSVAAADRNGGLADFSNFGRTTVDIAAPGVDIASTYPAETGFPVGWAYMDGTSMASPHVTGVAALIASQDPSLRTTAGIPALRARLLATGKSLPLTANDTVTGRIVDARFALDWQPPVAAAPNSYSFLVGSTLGSTSISSTVGWPAATDDAAGVRNYQLDHQVGGSGGWTTVALATTTRTASRALSLSSPNRLRVLARDFAGNIGTFATGPTVTPTLYQETTSLATYGGTWSTSTSSSYSGGRSRYATKAGAWASLRFTGRAVALVAPKGVTRGSAKVYVDGTYVGTVSLYRSTTASRNIVFARSWTSSGSHTLKVVLSGTSGHPRFDVDGFVVLR